MDRVRKNLKSDEIHQLILKVINENKPQTVKQLSIILKEKLDLSEKEIIEIIINLQIKGEIGLKNINTKSLAGYMRTGGALWYWITCSIEIITAIMVFTISESLYPWFYIRNVLGLIFVLVLPGFTVIKTVFPSIKSLKGHSEPLETIERIALSIGTSLALVSIISLILYYSPWGVEIAPIVLLLVTFTSVFATIGLVREYQVLFD